MSALLREHEDTDTALSLAEFATGVLQGDARAGISGGRECQRVPESGGDGETAPPVGGPPDLTQVLDRVQAMGIDPVPYLAYAQQRWGSGWKLNPQGRLRAWDELERHRNDPVGYADKVDAAIGGRP